MRKKHVFFLIGIVLLAGIVSVGYYLYNKPHASAANEAASVVITADSLFNAYARDEKTADQQYQGKIIEVKGALSDIARSANGTDNLTLASGRPGAGVSCQLYPGDSAVKEKKIGQTITIKGKCTGFLMDVNLVDCVIK